MISDSIEFQLSGSAMSVSGRLDAEGAGEVWDKARAAVAAGCSVVECTGIEYLDGGGASLFMMMKAVCRDQGSSLVINGLRPEFTSFLDLFDLDKAAPPSEHDNRKGGIRNWIISVGLSGQAVAADMREQIEFTGNCVFASLSTATLKNRLRWPDFWLTCEKVGADGLPIILLIGFLMGLIMSFQSAVSLMRFGLKFSYPICSGWLCFASLALW